MTLQYKMQGYNRDKIAKIIKLSLEQINKAVKEGQYSIEEIKVAFLMRALDIAVENNYIADIYV